MGERSITSRETTQYCRYFVVFTVLTEMHVANVECKYIVCTFYYKLLMYVGKVWDLIDELIKPESKILRNCK